ncbi:unnamed protein product [Rotaria sp. Silwood1]|nr:unnamed protein product [Rotaria sp. Silwood1]CAF3344733.1 unnamed protein product [Rotaria sp. Silwood1]CAF4500438.1 unnamed protein product [Rotaria sp. Silwood1]CAF4740546.1 unnamed protein product [Rotaria sp. Silwood1]
MFSYSFGIRRLCIGFINRINNKELFVQSYSFVRYQTQFNLKLTNENENENEQKFGLFKSFNVSQQTQNILKGFSLKYFK